MGMFQVWISGLLLAGSLGAYAQTATVNNKYNLVDTPEGTIAMAFEDGREAQLLTVGSGILTYPVDMKMTENLCHPEFAKPDCRIILRLESTRIRVIWTKHPDASKIGQIVKYVSSAGSAANTIFEDFGIIQDEEKNPSLLICDDYRWMTGKTEKAIPRNNLILSWGTETNFTNGETNQNENLTFSGAFNMEMNALFGQMYQMKSKQYISFSESNLALVSGGPSTLVIRNSKTQDLCQIQFNTDLTLARSASDRSEEQLKKGLYEKRPINPNTRMQALMSFSYLSSVTEFQ
jgi:hypothetical protein